MTSPELCRACLATSLKLYNIEDHGLLELYEKLTSFQLLTEDSCPDTLCYICVQQLQRCSRFSATAQRSEKYLRDLLVNNVQVTKETVATLKIVPTLSTVTLELLTLDDCISTDTDPSFETTIKEVKIEFPDSEISREDIMFNKTERVSTEEIKDKLTEYLEISTEDNKKVKKEISHDDCGECSLKFLTNENFSTLKKTHKQMFCEQCDKHFATTADLNGHIMSTHTGKKSFYCSACNVGFEKPDKYRRHMDYHDKDKPYPCSTCPKRFEFGKNLYRHMSIHGEEKTFACSKCDLTFRVPCRLKKHMLTHAGNKPYLCWCKKSFRYPFSLRRHILTHTNHKCDKCNVTFDKTSTLNKHKRDHIKGRPYYCEKCDLEFSMLSIFALHMSKHSEQSDIQENIDITELPKSKNHSKSKEQIETPLTRTKHSDPIGRNETPSLRTKHSDPTEKNETALPKTKNSDPIERNETPLSETKHSDPIEQNETQLSRVKRRKRTENKTQLPRSQKRRIRNVPFCPVCKKQQDSHVQLKLHMRTHTGEKPYTCTQCSKGFQSSTSLKYHKRTHTGEKVCSCEICGISFTQISAMNKHMVLHTGQVPYACHLCDKAYKQSGQLSAHIKNLHQGVRYFCDLCNGRFTAKQYLKRHMNSHAGIKPYACIKCGQKFATSTSVKRHMKNTCKC